MVGGLIMEVPKVALGGACRMRCRTIWSGFRHASRTRRIPASEATNAQCARRYRWATVGAGWCDDKAPRGEKNLIRSTDRHNGGVIRNLLIVAQGARWSSWRAAPTGVTRGWSVLQTSGVGARRRIVELMCHRMKRFRDLLIR